MALLIVTGRPKVADIKASLGDMSERHDAMRFAPYRPPLPSHRGPHTYNLPRVRLDARPREVPSRVGPTLPCNKTLLKMAVATSISALSPVHLARAARVAQERRAVQCVQAQARAAARRHAEEALRRRGHLRVGLHRVDGQARQTRRAAPLAARRRPTLLAQSSERLGAHGLPAPCHAPQKRAAWARPHAPVGRHDLATLTCPEGGLMELCSR